ncbi:Kunitz/Bovine pancreatic trypsin inhibitor domain protein [Oesophagostomum dentatum]|uniref:Kunitz/Bovine pancreatic trypsin inhibitor domain protein n=1 Tax=Oesophagostomum dentatum TaxID=61180 RepID=A0A0B1TH90_OESDE|nr:Kunitz/Bovine pancreatic trypsin inhibitor domain protein [Oesophagostomum dentatum]
MMEANNYAYDVKQQKCVAFKYGGCLGNENNFETLKKCRSLCDGVVDPTPSGPSAGVCALPISTGKCRAALRRYGYDSTLKKCVSFIYGGCEGNANRFETMEDCQSSCEQQDMPSTIPGNV